MLHLLFTVLRAELSLLKQHVEAQAKELDHRMRRIEELEEKERVANESVCYLCSIDCSVIDFGLPYVLHCCLI